MLVMCSAATATPLTERVRTLAHGAAAAQTLTDAELRVQLVELEEARNTVEAEQAIVMVEMHRRAEVEDARDAAPAPLVPVPREHD